MIALALLRMPGRAVEDFSAEHFIYFGDEPAESIDYDQVVAVRGLYCFTEDQPSAEALITAYLDDTIGPAHDISVDLRDISHLEGRLRKEKMIPETTPAEAIAELEAVAIVGISDDDRFMDEAINWMVETYSVT